MGKGTLGMEKSNVEDRNRISLVRVCSVSDVKGLDRGSASFRSIIERAES